MTADRMPGTEADVLTEALIVERLADALRRADYMNWTAVELAEKLLGTVERLMREARQQGAREAGEYIREAIEALHKPTDGIGYLADGSYGIIDPACTSCGVNNEYAVPWPCPTVLALAEAPRG